MAIVFLLLPDGAHAQTGGQRPQEQPLERTAEPLPNVEEAAEAGAALDVSAGVTFTTEYWFRGYLQENQGFIAQPYTEIGVGLIAPEDESYALDATVGMWNSFHSEKTGFSDTGPSAWYESDLYGGVTFTTGNFEVGTVYTFYTYPNGAFDTIQEAGLFGGYAWDFGDDPENNDDVDVSLGGGGGVYFETADGNGPEDAYLELNVEPGLEFETGGGVPVTLSFPVAVGLSLDDYYFDDAGDEEFLGYVSVAAQAAVPLPLPARYGEWELAGAVQGIFLNADGLKTIPDTEDANLLGSLSVGVAF